MANTLGSPLPHPGYNGHTTRVKLLFSPLIMEVENHPKWKDMKGITTIGDTPIFHWAMIMGGRVDGTQKFGALEDDFPFQLGNFYVPY